MRKPHSTLLVLGPRGHGKTTLTEGLLRATRPAEPGIASPDAAPRVEEQTLPLPRSGSLLVRLAEAELETTRRRFTLLDPGEHSAARKRLVGGPLAGLPAVDGALLVVDPGLGRGPEFKEQLRLLRRAGVSGLVLFLNRAAPEDPEHVDRAEYELRSELCDEGFAGDAVPIVRGSAAELLHGEPAGIEAVVALHEALDEHIPIPAEERPRLAVARILETGGREAAVECRRLAGALAPGEMVEIVGLSPTRTAQLVSLAESPTAPGEAGATVRCALRGVTPRDLRAGQVLSLPGASAAHSRFEAELLFLAETTPRTEECLFSFFEVFTVGGVARPLAEGTGAFEVELSTAVALSPGDGFGLLAAGELIGVGLVTAVRGASRKRRRGALSPAGLALAFVDTLNRGDRPDIAALSLCPPDDVLQATIATNSEDFRLCIRSGRILLRLVEGRTHAGFDYQSMIKQRIGAEYLGLLEPDERRRWRREPIQLLRGQSVSAYSDVGDRKYVWREYTLNAGVTLLRTRFQLRVTREGRREDMTVEIRAAEFEVKKGTWYLFDFDFPSSWQTL